MKNFVLTYKDGDGNDKTVELRLTSNDCEKIEKQQDCSIIDFLQKVSVTNIITMLLYMRKGTGTWYTREDIYTFYDELIDAGYTMMRILDEIIYETLVASGIISKEDLEKIRGRQKEVEGTVSDEYEKNV